MSAAGGVRLRLPATSANLGPGFDAVGLAMSLWLTVEAESADAFAIEATGRNADVCGRVSDSLILSTYRNVMGAAGREARPLRLRLENEIPLGMGCGSSAAALLAGVALADHFGGLGLGDAGIVAEASRLEGHPDNVAACWYGGFTVSAGSVQNSGVLRVAQDDGEKQRHTVRAVTFAGDPEWRLLLAMQPASLATQKARALLPEMYSRADAVFNVQRVALLVAAFAERRLDLLGTAMGDRVHQPYRMEACPLLKRLLPLSGMAGVAGVTLSGAGPSVLMVLETEADEAEVRRHVAGLVEADVELISLRIAGGAERVPVGA